MSRFASSALFAPLSLGAAKLQHRVALAPLTRYRADDAHVHTDLGVQYYSQRASTPGTLLITEATFIDNAAAGYRNAPGIWNQAQALAWKKIVDAVHARGSSIFVQLWALGRTAIPEVLASEGPYDLVSSGNLAMPGSPDVPRSLTKTEISEYVQWYVRAARLAVQVAGFDGVEIHGANGYLVDQFIQDVSNNRIDEYGGSIENRVRFPLEIIDAVSAAVGEEHVAIRLSPWETFQGMGMADPIPTFSYLLEQLATRHTSLAYVHLTEPRVAGGVGVSGSLEFARKIWAPRPIILAGGYSPADARQRAEEGAQNGENIVIAFGRHFLANPDLPRRIREGFELNEYDRSTFYAAKSPVGYIDYPFVEVEKREKPSEVVEASIPVAVAA